MILEKPGAETKSKGKSKYKSLWKLLSKKTFSETRRYCLVLKLEIRVPNTKENSKYIKLWKLLSKKSVFPDT